MQKIAILAGAILAGILSAPALAETRTLDVGPFTAVDITSGIKAEIVAGGTQSVVADAPSVRDFDDFRYEVRNDVLHVWYDWNVFRLFDFIDRRMTLTISTSDIKSIEVTSGATVSAKGIDRDNLRVEVTSGATATVDAKATTYDLEATSGASLTIGGACQSARLDVSSGASVGAKALACAGVTADASSGAHIDITATGTADVDASSGAAVTVFGHPSVEHLDASSGASVQFP
ncbi:MAG TPA: DUF2807 domain-containing protein [Devosia sp.]|nr:DUF2807 domain-containing protein [Devosia sp.]